MTFSFQLSGNTAKGNQISLHQARSVLQYSCSSKRPQCSLVSQTGRFYCYQGEGYCLCCVINKYFILPSKTVSEMAQSLSNEGEKQGEDKFASGAEGAAKKQKKKLNAKMATNDSFF